MLSAEHAQRVLSSLNQQRAAGRFCDAALNLGGGAVYLAHRNILACFSELFQQPGVSSAPCVELSLQECPKDGLELLLDFVYTGDLRLDPDNLDQVRQAASSLCVLDALALCQSFHKTPADPAVLKRKRGRPKKSKLSADPPRISALEENLITKEESGSDLAPAGLSSDAAATATATATTTRSGRVVKGPRRLVTDESVTDFTENSSKKAQILPSEKEGVDAEHRSPDQLPGQTQINDPQLDGHSGKDVVKLVEEEGDDDGELERNNGDSDEEYLPGEEPRSSSPSMSTARRRRAPGKSDRGDKRVEGETKKDSVQCPTCDKSFKSKYYLKVHNRRHTGEKPFACLKCGKRYFRKENLVMHEFRNCETAQTYKCTTCLATFGRKEELRVHTVSHTENMPYKCSTCPEQFLYKKNLTFHMMKVHGFPKPHACPQCQKTFLTRSELRVHEAAKHRGEKPFVCEECGHRASSRNGLQMHIKAIHRNERPFVCNLCGHAFSQKNNLNMHLRVHSGERPYQCHLCGKTFRTQGSLDKHHRTHTGERPFACDACQQRFTEKGALLRHKASKHEEGRPHSCHICSKTFKAKEQLRVHLRRHKGMRKFECVDCGYKFTRQAHLRRHLQIHKRTENYNPRQRKLRNVVVQEVEAALVTEEEAAAVQEAAVQEQEGTAALGSSCIVRVVIESGGATVAAAGQELEAVEGFSVPAVLQQTQLSAKAFEYDGVVGNLPGGNA